MQEWASKEKITQAGKNERPQRAALIFTECLFGARYQGCHRCWCNVLGHPQLDGTSAHSQEVGAELGREREPLCEGKNALFSGICTCVLRHNNLAREKDFNLVPSHPRPIVRAPWGTHPPHRCTISLGICVMLKAPSQGKSEGWNLTLLCWPSPESWVWSFLPLRKKHKCALCASGPGSTLCHPLMTL